MAKLKTDPITQADLIDYLDKWSDFAFEVRTLNALRRLGFDCEHGGTYDDPATDKPREFDIRATKEFPNCYLRLAVECKNLQANFPLLIYCLPRRAEEAFHEIVYSVDPEREPMGGPALPMYLQPMSKSARLSGRLTFYKAGGPVGKSCDKVGKTPSGELVSGESAMYEKWSQALSSAFDLTALACADGKERTKWIALSLVIPVVVVPNGQLWQTIYDAKGNRTTEPERVDRCSYYVAKIYRHPSPAGENSVTVSHLEFVTSDGLMALVDDLCGDDTKRDRIFPIDDVIRILGIKRPRPLLPS